MLMLKIITYTRYVYRCGEWTVQQELNGGSTYHVCKQNGAVMGIFFDMELAREFKRIQELKSAHHDRQQPGFIYSHREPDGAIRWAWEETGF